MKTSWRVITSPSMRSTSVTWVIRREPSLSRLWCTIRSTAEATCSRIARIGRSMPAISTIVSMRARVSRGPLEWTVQSEPSWPVFMAWSMSSAEASRTSPTTMRSGRMRSEFFTRSRISTAPLPSMLDGRDSSRSTWSWCSWSSAASSMVTMRSSVGMNDESTLRVVVLPGAGAAGDDDVQPALDAGGQEVGGALRVGAERDQVVGGVRVGGELADGQQRAVHGQRRDDRVDAAAVGQAGVHHRAGLVDATADPGHDLVDRAAQVRLVVEVALDLDQPAAALDVDAVRAVDHDLGEVGVAQERLDRAVAEDVVGDLLGDPGPLGGGQQDVLGLHGLLQGALDHVLELGLGQLGVVQLGPELLEQGVVDLGLEVAGSRSRPSSPVLPRRSVMVAIASLVRAR